MYGAVSLEITGEDNSMVASFSFCYLVGVQKGDYMELFFPEIWERITPRVDFIHLYTHPSYCRL